MRLQGVIFCVSAAVVLAGASFTPGHAADGSRQGAGARRAGAGSQPPAAGPGILTASFAAGRGKTSAQASAPTYRDVYAGPTYDAFPAAQLLANGDLFVAFRVGTAHISPDGRLVSARSKDGGLSWSSAAIFDEEGIDDRVNIGLTQLSGGTLILPFFQDDGSASAGAFVLKSSDNGVTWGQKIVIHPKFVPYGKLIELPDGRLILPAYTGRNSTLPVRSLSLFESTDRGNTWAIKSTIASGTSTVYSETAVIPLSADNYLAAIRVINPDGSNFIHRSTSVDGGNTWSHPSPLFDGVSPDIIRLRDGRLLLTVGDRVGVTGVRGHVSADNGATWSAGTMIVTGPPDAGGDIGYPSSLRLPGGNIFTAYYGGPAVDISCAIYDEAYVAAPAEPPAPTPAGTPVLLTEENSARAIALDSVTWVRDPFPPVAAHNLSPDRRTRISLFAVNMGAEPVPSAAAVTARAEDSRGRAYPLTVEFVGRVPGFDWLTQVVVKLPDDLTTAGDVWVSISLHGVASNKALVGIRPVED